MGENQWQVMMPPRHCKQRQTQQLPTWQMWGLFTENLPELLTGKGWGKEDRRPTTQGWQNDQGNKNLYAPFGGLGTSIPKEYSATLHAQLVKTILDKLDPLLYSGSAVLPFCVKSACLNISQWNAHWYLWHYYYYFWKCIDIKQCI